MIARFARCRCNRLVISGNRAFAEVFLMRRRPSPAVIELQQKIRGLLAYCEAPEVEGVWLDMVGRGECYIDASLCRREIGLAPLPGRRTLSCDQDLEPNWVRVQCTGEELRGRFYGQTGSRGDAPDAGHATAVLRRRLIIGRSALQMIPGPQI